MNHPTMPVLRAFLRSLSVADAGLLLHLLECPRCARRAWTELSPRPMRRRPGEPRPPEPPDAAAGESSPLDGRGEPAGPLAAAELCRELARERQDERRFEEALALLERSASLYGRAAHPPGQAAILGELGSLHLSLGQEEDALAAFERALELGSGTPDPGLAVGAETGLAGRLAALDDPLDGRRLLASLRERLGRRRVAQQRLDLLRQEGLLAAYTRQEHPAERLLRESWAGYLRANLPGHAALAALDLAALFLRQGRPSALRDLAADIRRALRGGELPPPVQDALDGFVPALESGQVSGELLAGIAAELARRLSEPAAPAPAGLPAR